MAAMTSFRAEKCCHLANDRKVSSTAYAVIIIIITSIGIFWCSLNNKELSLGPQLNKAVSKSDNRVK